MFNPEDRPQINGVPALIDSFRMREKMGQNGLGGSKRAIVKGVKDDIPYHEYEDACARPKTVREAILDPYLDESYMAAHVYLHSDLFQEDIKDILLVPEFSIPDEDALEDYDAPSCEKRLLDLAIECRNRNLEGEDWLKIVEYVTSANIAPSQYAVNQFVAMRGYIIDGIFFERAALRWEALMMAGSTQGNLPILVSKYPPLMRSARPGLDPLEFIGDTYILLSMASRQFRDFFSSEKSRLGL